MKKLIYSFWVLLSFCAPATARMSHTGDMLADSGWTNYQRPSVPSDALRRADLFPPVPLMLNENADLFDHVRQKVYYVDPDMLHAESMSVPYAPVFHPGAYMAPGQAY